VLRSDCFSLSFFSFFFHMIIEEMTVKRDVSITRKSVLYRRCDAYYQQIFFYE
jgi:hypothetical protein